MAAIADTVPIVEATAAGAEDAGVAADAGEADVTAAVAATAAAMAGMVEAGIRPANQSGSSGAAKPRLFFTVGRDAFQCPATRSLLRRTSSTTCRIAVTTESGDSSMPCPASTTTWRPRVDKREARLQLMNLNLVILRCFFFQARRSPIPSSSQHDKRAIA